MRCEFPIFIRCCFCFPLRYGLLVFSYVKEIANLLFLAFIIYTLNEEHNRKNMGSIARARNYVMPSLLIIFVILDIGFTLLFIIGGHSKNYKKIRIFYRYSMVVQCVYAGNLAYFVGHCVSFAYAHPQYIYLAWYVYEPLIMTTIFIIVIQLYMIILVRSEFVKLKNSTQFEFVNREAEEKCTANIEFEKEIPDSG